MTLPTPHSQLPAAALWKRLASTIYDCLILGAISFVYFALVTLIAAKLGHGASNDYQPTAEGLFVQLGWVIVILSFYGFFWRRVGQTVAMKAWKLRLVRTDGKPLTIRLCLFRAILGFFAFAVFGLGYLWAIIDSNNEALHDKLTKTRVVSIEE
ncbi:MAG: putative RDD family membrane protein YckC [Flavobacteriales bacterium]|jgi:uncharacterized RDD family membrane protein YckC